MGLIVPASLLLPPCLCPWLQALGPPSAPPPPRGVRLAGRAPRMEGRLPHASLNPRRLPPIPAPSCAGHGGWAAAPGHTLCGRRAAARAHRVARAQAQQPRRAWHHPAGGLLGAPVVQRLAAPPVQRAARPILAPCGAEALRSLACRRARRRARHCARRRRGARIGRGAGRVGARMARAPVALDIARTRHERLHSIRVTAGACCGRHGKHCGGRGRRGR